MPNTHPLIQTQLTHASDDLERATTPREVRAASEALIEAMQAALDADAAFWGFTQAA